MDDPRSTPGVHMAAEIREQPRVLENILRHESREIRSVAATIGARKPRFILLAGRGTSDHAALYAKYLIETRLGLPAGLVSPSTITLYGSSPDLTDVLFVGVSQSGSSPDLIEPMEQARRCGAITLAVTNAPRSPLAQAAELHLCVAAGDERAIAATKTYTAQLMVLFLLVEALANRMGDEAAQIPDEVAQVLEMDGVIAHEAVRYRFAEQIVITSRGYNYPTAREAALKLMETSSLIAHAFSSADLLHGPMAVIEKGFPVIAIAPEGRVSIALGLVLEQLEVLGADTLVVGAPGGQFQGTRRLPLPHLADECVSPIVAIIPLQMLAWHLARERGVDPDEPRGLSKITKTR
jgi:glucosamine--fructose-6-phosphate aminotransferase (isomerizing)